MRATPTLILIAAFSTVSCYALQPVAFDDLGNERRSRLWVTRHDASVVVIHDAQLFRGNLVGFIDGKYHELGPTDVRHVHMRKLETARTASLIGLGVAGFVLAAVALSGAEDHFDPCAGDDDCVEMQWSAPR
jgi:hypothetical protein